MPRALAAARAGRDFRRDEDQGRGLPPERRLIIKKDYKLKDLKVKIDDADTAAFWKRVADAVDAGLE